MICRGKFEVFDKDTGKLLFKNKNAFVNAGLNAFAGLMNGESISAPSHIAVVTSNTAVAATQTGLVGELARIALDSRTRTNNKLVMIASFLAGVATGVWEETGVFNADTAGTMFSRGLTGTYTKGALDKIEVHWTYEWNDAGDS